MFWLIYVINSYHFYHSLIDILPPSPSLVSNVRLLPCNHLLQRTTLFLHAHFTCYYFHLCTAETYLCAPPIKLSPSPPLLLTPPINVNSYCVNAGWGGNTLQTLLLSVSGGGEGDLGRLRDTLSPHTLVGVAFGGGGLAGGVWTTGGGRLGEGGTSSSPFFPSSFFFCVSLSV